MAECLCKMLVDEIQKSFLHLLIDYLPKNILEKAKNQRVKIISVCCGRFREAQSLFDYFSLYPNKLDLYGIDIDKELISLAENEPAVKQNKSHVHLKLADASKVENYKEWLVDGLFDLVIIRHPEITFNKDIFVKIFSLSGSLLGGYLLITTHYENEKELIKLLLKSLKFNLIVDVENQYSPHIEKDGKLMFADRFLLIGSRNM